MKLAFISDIHGNAVALEAVLDDIDQKGVDKVFVLGDICFRGLEPKRSLELIKALDTQVIKGNADEWIVRGIQQGEVPDQALNIMNKERDWALSQLDENNLKFLQELPSELNLEYGGLTIHAFHATPNSLFEVVTPLESEEDLKDKLMKEDADIYIYGHIHKSYIRYVDGKTVINTGSVGLPFDGLNKASYLILDIEEGSYQTSIVRVDYDVKQVISQVNESDYPNQDLLGNLLINAKIN